MYSRSLSYDMHNGHYTNSATARTVRHLNVRNALEAAHGKNIPTQRVQCRLFRDGGATAF